MLYILLGIIAVGVLLASEEGKRLLGYLIGISVVGGIGYIAVIALILLYGWFSDWSEDTKISFGVLVFIIIATFSYGIISVLLEPKLKKLDNYKEKMSEQSKFWHIYKTIGGLKGFFKIILYSILILLILIVVYMFILLFITF